LSEVLFVYRSIFTTVLNLTKWQENAEYITFNDLDIFVKDSGGGKPPLLLIHGFPTASIDWQLVWPRLTKNFRCITFDLIGFGLTSKPQNAPITIMQQADMCRFVLSKKGIKVAHVLCHDYGVSVGQELLAASDEVFAPQSCIFLNGGLYPGVHRPRLIQKLLMSPIGSLVAKLTSYKRFALTMRTICTQPISDNDMQIYWELMVRDNGRAMLPALIRYMAERKTHQARWGAATNYPPCPTLLINGVDDPISGGHLANAYEERVSNANVVRLQHTGHYPQVESPDAVCESAMHFWRNIQAIT
jgi:pimeloyl-ACP methyl ester carboxylesterase